MRNHLSQSITIRLSSLALAMTVSMPNPAFALRQTGLEESPERNNFLTRLGVTSEHQILSNKSSAGLEEPLDSEVHKILREWIDHREDQTTLSKLLQDTDRFKRLSAPQQLELAQNFYWLLDIRAIRENLSNIFLSPITPAIYNAAEQDRLGYAQFTFASFVQMSVNPHMLSITFTTSFSRPTTPSGAWLNTLVDEAGAVPNPQQTSTEDESWPLEVLEAVDQFGYSNLRSSANTILEQLSGTIDSTVMTPSLYEIYRDVYTLLVSKTIFEKEGREAIERIGGEMDRIQTIAKNSSNNRFVRAQAYTNQIRLLSLQYTLAEKISDPKAERYSSDSALVNKEFRDFRADTRRQLGLEISAGLEEGSLNADLAELQIQGRRAFPVDEYGSASILRRPEAKFFYLPTTQGNRDGGIPSSLFAIQSTRTEKPDGGIAGYTCQAASHWLARKLAGRGHSVEIVNLTNNIWQESDVAVRVGGRLVSLTPSVTMADPSIKVVHSNTLQQEDEEGRLQKATSLPALEHAGVVVSREQPEPLLVIGGHFLPLEFIPRKEGSTDTGILILSAVDIAPVEKSQKEYMLYDDSNRGPNSFIVHLRAIWVEHGMGGVEMHYAAWVPLTSLAEITHKIRENGKWSPHLMMVSGPKISYPSHRVIRRELDQQEKKKLREAILRQSNILYRIFSTLNASSLALDFGVSGTSLSTVSASAGLEEKDFTRQDKFGVVAIGGTAALIPDGFENAMVVTAGLEQTKAVLGLKRVSADHFVAIAGGMEEADVLQQFGIPPEQILQRSRWSTFQEALSAATRLAQEILQGRGIAARILEAAERNIQALLAQLEQLLLPDTWKEITAETFEQIRRINQLGV